MDKTKDRKVYGFIIRSKEGHGLYGESDLTLTLTAVSVENGYKIRNLSASYGDEPFADFSVKAFISEKYEGVSAEPAFYDCYKVDRRDAQRMVAVFTKLEKGCDKLNAQFGYARDYGSQVARIAQSLGITQIIRTKPSHSSNYDDQEHSFFTIGQGVSVLNGLIDEFRAKHPLPVKEVTAV